ATFYARFSHILERTLVLYGQIEQRDLGRYVQPYRGEGSPDPTAYIQIGSCDSIRSFRIRCQEVGQADTCSRKAQLDLPSMIMPGQGQPNVMLGSQRKDLRSMR